MITTCDACSTWMDRVTIINVIYVGIFIVYVIILILALSILVNGFICDDHTCHTFVNALTKKTDKAVALNLLDRVGEQDSLWPIAFIAKIGRASCRERV